LDVLISSMGNKTDTLAKVIDRFLPVLNAKTKLPSHTLRCLDAVQKCRTPYMGGPRTYGVAVVGKSGRRTIAAATGIAHNAGL